MTQTALLSPPTKSRQKKKISKAKLNCSGHETFQFRYTWLKKIYDAVSKNPNLFKDENAMSELGVGRSMVNAMKHWGISTQIIDCDKDNGSCTVTNFAKKLFDDKGWDPYLEDLGTLWLLHWKIATNIENSTTWYYGFNKFTSIEFTKEQLLEGLINFIDSEECKISRNTISRDVDCFIKTYITTGTKKNSIIEDTVDCPLVELDLIEETGIRGFYRFSRGAKHSITDELFAYCLLEHWENSNRTNVIHFDEIAYKEGSPGFVFKLDEDSLAFKLASLEKLTNGKIRFDETSSLKQIYKDGDVDKFKYLDMHYKRNS